MDKEKKEKILERKNYLGKADFKNRKCFSIQYLRLFYKTKVHI